MTKRILSGIQPTSDMHLGNYLGAVRHWARMQHDSEFDCMYMIADLHAITGSYDPSDLTLATRELGAALIAAGIDTNKSTIFVQSSSYHPDLMWLLSSVTQMGKLERMTQFKEKAGKNRERASLGLFSYPVLMAADILLYKGTHVPVGDDQKQHLELAREIASSFNHKYEQEFFPLPESVVAQTATRVMSLRDGTQKMSKSAESDNSRINLTDDADTIAKKIRKAKTDPEPLPDNMDGFEGRPEALNLVTIYAALADKSVDDVVDEFAGKQFGTFKPALADLAVAHLEPITARVNALMNDPAELDKILAKGNEKAAVIAEATLTEVREIMGFWS